MSNTHKIAVIGAGFSGTMVAVHLLRQAKHPLTVYLIEPNLRQFGRGVAYSTDQDCHLLNVPAFNMSAFPDDPGHFFNWAKTRESKLLNPPWLNEVVRTSFLLRRVYGDYLVDLLDKAERSAAANVSLEKKIDKVVAMSVEPGHVNISLFKGEVLQAQKVVLAIGNLPPGDLAVKNPDFYQSRRYFSNPWQPDVLPALLKTESCLLIGSGLTMVDWVISLVEEGYRGKIHSISRRGLWPQVHRLFPTAACPIDVKAGQPSVRSWLHQLRQSIRQSGCDWRLAVDSLRPASQPLWLSLPVLEQRRFLRHLRTFWDCHRHRLAPVVGERLAELQNTGQLCRHIGRILEYSETGQGVDVLIRRRGQTGTQTIRVDAVVNCSGSESNYRKLENALVKDLFRQHLVRPDALALGLDASPDGALIDDSGIASNRLFTLGPPQKGIFWETTAVPEIREQAAKLAGVLLAHFECR